MGSALEEWDEWNAQQWRDTGSYVCTAERLAAALAEELRRCKRGRTKPRQLQHRREAVKHAVKKYKGR